MIRYVAEKLFGLKDNKKMIRTKIIARKTVTAYKRFNGPRKSPVIKAAAIGTRGRLSTAVLLDRYHIGKARKHSFSDP